MAASQSGGPWERRIAPRALLAGVVVSFVACCLLGRAVSRRNIYRAFTRFHPHISCLSLYYPTASQARALARSQLTPDRIAVVVGGSSVMYGYGQGAENLWTKHLQAQLGDRYRVFNFAIQGAPPADVGPAAAEALQRDHPKVIFVTNIWAGTGGLAGSADGALHRYFFWDAYYKRLLSRCPEREARLAALAEEKKDDAAYAELKRRARLDSYLYNQDLWTAISYRYASTVWCPLVAGSVTRARMRYPDSDYIPPGQHTPQADAALLELARASVGARWPLPAGPDVDYGVTPLVSSFKGCVPAPFRRRTLVVMSRHNPYHLTRLPPETQAAYDANFPESIRALEQAGFAAMEMGRGYTDMDYIDLTHFSALGAPKMAAEVGARVRRLARELGYTEEGAVP